MNDENNFMNENPHPSTIRRIFNGTHRTVSIFNTDEKFEKEKFIGMRKKNHDGVQEDQQKTIDQE